MENITKAKATSLEHVDLTVADSQLSISQRFKFTFCSVFHLLHHFAIQLNHLLHWGQTSRDCFRTTKIAAQQVEELHEISINAVSWRPGSQKKEKKEEILEKIDVPMKPNMSHHMDNFLTEGLPRVTTENNYSFSQLLYVYCHWFSSNKVLMNNPETDPEMVHLEIYQFLGLYLA